MIDTYATLQTGIANWLARDDAELTERIPEFIQLAEARIRRNQRWFRTMYSLENAGDYFEVTDSPMTLPTDVQEIVGLWGQTANYRGPITVLDLAGWRDLVQNNNDTTGVPQFAFIQSRYGAPSQLHLFPRPAETIEIDFEYIQKLVPLSVTATNELLSAHPDLYLYAALVESAPFLEHDERLPIWENRWNATVVEINRESQRASRSASRTGVSITPIG